MQRKANSHLTHDERCQIYILLQEGISIRGIACRLKVSHSTIARDIKRNTGERGYRYKQASLKAQERRQKNSRRAYRLTAPVLSRIKKMLEQTQASPEQISGRLLLEDGTRISHESIYRHIQKDQKNGGELYRHLRHRRKKYNKRFGKKSGRGCIPDRTDISERPKEADSKKVFGHFELDTIVGKNHAGAIVSIVDRHTKIAILRLVARGTAELVTAAICEAMAEFASNGLLRSFTSDNGKEFSSHAIITAQTGAKVYFATPYHSWERGLNEHTNGLVRQYFPKGTDFTQLTPQDVANVQHALNHRARKVLEYRTPAEALAEVLKSKRHS